MKKILRGSIKDKPKKLKVNIVLYKGQDKLHEIIRSEIMGLLIQDIYDGVLSGGWRNTRYAVTYSYEDADPEEVKDA